MDELYLEDGSNDRLYFTMVPNIVLNHSTAVDQALYLQMKRFAGEKSGGGYCSASKRTLMEKLGVGLKALNTSLQYLVDHKWIEKIGTRRVMTNGGAQEIDVYRVNDIWKLNTDHYKGVAESAPLPKGVAERSKGVSESAQGVSESAPTKNYIKHINTAQSAAPVRELVKEDSDLSEGFGDSKSPRVTGNQKKAYDELLAWSEHQRGFPFPPSTRTKQYRAFKNANKAKISREKLMERWEEMSCDKFWQKAGFDWMNVVNQCLIKP